jgi:hypothetical protein
VPPPLLPRASRPYSIKATPEHLSSPIHSPQRCPRSSLAPIRSRRRSPPQTSPWQSRSSSCCCYATAVDAPLQFAALAAAVRALRRARTAMASPKLSSAPAAFHCSSPLALPPGLPLALWPAPQNPSQSQDPPGAVVCRHRHSGHQATCHHGPAAVGCSRPSWGEELVQPSPALLARPRHGRHRRPSPLGSAGPSRALLGLVKKKKRDVGWNRNSLLARSRCKIHDSCE